MTKAWFETWFDAPYYPLLYKHRDHEEAALFLNRLLEKLALSPPATMLDVACGRGRHAVYLHQKGFTVTGFDLSEASIQEARKQEARGLHFEVRDMRQPFTHPQWDLVLNLFTSFGYFDADTDSFRAMQAMASAVLPGGSLVLDYLEPGSVQVAPSLAEAIPEEYSTEGVTFVIRKYREGGFVYKDIFVEDGAAMYTFQEKVRLFEKGDLLHMAERCGLEPMAVFGDYALSPWTAGCPRQIHWFKKSAL